MFTLHPPNRENAGEPKSLQKKGNLRERMPYKEEEEAEKEEGEEETSERAFSHFNSPEFPLRLGSHFLALDSPLCLLNLPF